MTCGDCENYKNGICCINGLKMNPLYITDPCKYFKNANIRQVEFDFIRGNGLWINWYEK